MPPARAADTKHTGLTDAATAVMVLFLAWPTHDEETKSEWRLAFDRVKGKVLATRNFIGLVGEDDLHSARIWAWHVLDEAKFDVCGFLMLPNGDLEVRRTCNKWRDSEFRAEFELIFSFRRQELGMKQRKRAHKAFANRLEHIERFVESASASADPDELTLPPPPPPMTLWDPDDLALPPAPAPMSPTPYLPDITDMSAEDIATALDLPLPFGPI